MKSISTELLKLEKKIGISLIQVVKSHSHPIVHSFMFLLKTQSCGRMIVSLTVLLLVSSATSQMDQLNETEFSISTNSINTQDDSTMIGDVAPASDADSTPPPSSINCWKCDSSINMKCISDSQNTEKESCQAINGCFVRKDAERLIRGCTSDLTSEQLEDCVQNENCQLCDTDDCNGTPWPVCYTCMSALDITCSRKQQTENTMTICNHVDDSCLIMVDGKGETTRKCGTQSECEGSLLCSVCLDFLCNDVVFPSERRKCHQCNGSIDLNCEQSQNSGTPEVCHNYLKSDGCFYYTIHGQMVRGCTSDVGAYNECRINGKSCMTCSESDGCNSMALYVEPALSCIKCSVDDPNCSWKQSSTKLTKCEKSRLYFHEETCYSNYNRQIRKTARGCSSDDNTFSATCSHDEDCKFCNISGCNGDNLMTDECIVCDDAHGVNCKKTVEPTVCNEEGEFDKRGCFTMVHSGELLIFQFLVDYNN